VDCEAIAIRNRLCAIEVCGNAANDIPSPRLFVAKVKCVLMPPCDHHHSVTTLPTRRRDLQRAGVRARWCSRGASG
jgi:hypothetical protein